MPGETGRSLDVASVGLAPGTLVLGGIVTPKYAATIGLSGRTVARGERDQVTANR
jgi:hypothetical protein